MRKGFLVSVLVLMIVAAFWMSVPVGCANIVPPAGGPRDTIGPKLVQVSPPDSSVNFRGDRIEFTFNEDLGDPRDMQNNLFFSPSFEINPELAIKANILTVRFRDTLDPRTTYILNFGKAIVDVTEGNPAPNLVYTFSTGPVLDSLEISGHVELAETGGVDTTLMVVLHKDLTDSAVRLKRPPYIVKLDRNGNFRFRNLPKDTFAIYAIGDAAVSKRYQQNTQLFAFADSPVVAGEADSVHLFAYREADKQGAAQGKTALPGLGKVPANDRRLRFMPSTTNEQDLMKDFTLSFAVPLREFDSTKMHLATDSVFNPAAFTASLDTSKTVVILQSAWQPGTPYHLILEQDFATDTAGRQLLKSDTLSFITKKNEDYGSIAIRLRNIDSTVHPVLQFIQNGQVVFSAPVSSGTFNQAMFAPGEYGLRILYDKNQNGQWDPGKFFEEKRQPELVKPIPRTITVKPNWDNEFEIAL